MRLMFKKIKGIAVLFISKLMHLILEIEKDKSVLFNVELEYLTAEIGDGAVRKCCSTELPQRRK